MILNYRIIIKKLLIYATFVVIAFTVQPIILDHFGEKFAVNHTTDIDSIKTKTFIFLIYLPITITLFTLILVLFSNRFKANTTVDRHLNLRALKDKEWILGRSLDKWLKIFQDNDSRTLFIKLSNEDDTESLKYQILLQQVTTTFLDILDDRYLRSDDYYTNYVKKVESARLEITEYLEETHSIKVKIRIYNEAIKKEKRSEDSAAGDDELTNQIINDMNIKKSNETIEENYKTLWKIFKILQNLIFEITDEPSHHEPYSQTSREEMILQVENFRKSF